MNDRPGGKSPLACSRRVSGADRITRAPQRRTRPSPEMLEERRLLASLVVTSFVDSANADTTPGTLRYAITQVNASNSTTNSIAFDFGGLPKTIFLTSALPQIVKPVTIDGTQAAASASPSVAIVNGYQAITDEGLSLGAGSDNSTIKGLAIARFADGILVASTNARIVGDSLGTDLSGMAAQPNYVGVRVAVTGTGATIGGTTAGAGNLLSGNTTYGVYLEAASNLVQGNTIGTDATGTKALGNGYAGVFVKATGATGATIGGTTAGSGNLLSGNASYGIYLEAASSLVQGNTIGTDATGTKAVANGYAGIIIRGAGATIGGATPGAGNLISGNTHDGIYLQAASSLIQGNTIGTDTSGTQSVANGFSGIDLNGPGATIGGTASGAGNLISGNTHYGIYVEASSGLIQSNKIGSDLNGTGALSNGADGVILSPSAQGNTIGGAAGAGNVIAFNGGSAVTTFGRASANTIRFNSFHGNASNAIDLNSDGVTPNTPGGANNTPLIASAVGGTIVGTLNASANSTYLLDFYASDPTDDSPSAPQGRNFVASATVTTNASGDVAFSVPYVAVPGRPILTATSTDPAGTTS